MNHRTARTALLGTALGLAATVTGCTSPTPAAAPTTTVSTTEASKQACGHFSKALDTFNAGRDSSKAPAEFAAFYAAAPNATPAIQAAATKLRQVGDDVGRLLVSSSDLSDACTAAGFPL